MFSVDFKTLQDVLEPIERVVAACVFGSAQNTTILDGSDLDIGVLFSSVPSLEERIQLREQLQRSLNFEDIDLVVLNEASPITKFEAICGRVILVKDYSWWAQFVSLTAREYEDEMVFLRKGLTTCKELQLQSIT
jgi:predicted nucleotidyltransferase